MSQIMKEKKSNGIPQIPAKEIPQDARELVSVLRKGDDVWFCFDQQATPEEAMLTLYHCMELNTGLAAAVIGAAAVFCSSHEEEEPPKRQVPFQPKGRHLT